MCLPEQSARDAALAELARLDPAALDAASLMGQITDLAGFISQAQGQLARLAGTLDATGGAAEAGHGSAAAFLRTSCGLSPGHAAAVTTPARGLAGRAPIRTAVEAGVISFDQAQIILRATSGLDDSTAEAVEMVLLDHAPGLDTARLRQFAAEVAYRADPDAAEEREKKRWDQRHLSFGLSLDNTGVLSGACGDAVSYEIVRTAAEAFSPPAGRMDDRTAAQRRMDGLVAACKSALDGGRAPERHGSAPHISILVHDQTLAQGAQAAGTSGPDAAAAPGGGAGTAAEARTGVSPGPAAGAPPPPERARHAADRPADPGPVLRGPDRRDPLARRPAARRRPHRPDRATPACAGRWRPGTAAAAGWAAARWPPGPPPTTSDPGARVAPPAWTTWRSSATCTTITSSTCWAGQSRATPTARSTSPTPAAG